MSALPVASRTCCWCAASNQFASSQRRVEDALKRRRAGFDDALGLLEPSGIGERLHGGSDLGVGVVAAGGH